MTVTVVLLQGLHIFTVLDRLILLMHISLTCLGSGSELGLKDLGW